VTANGRLTPAVARDSARQMRPLLHVEASLHHASRIMFLTRTLLTVAVADASADEVTASPRYSVDGHNQWDGIARATREPLWWLECRVEFFPMVIP
jgi:hypothetical protein